MKVLTYHNIADPPKEAKLKTLYVSQRKFEKQLWLLKTLGHRSFTTEAIDFSQRSVFLTFDDGYADFVDMALPLLERYNFKALVFVVVDRVGQYNTWDADKLRVKKPLMDWKDLEYIVKKGIEIGSHSLTHPFLTQIDPKDAQREIEGSKKKLEDRLGILVKSFCYPYGNYNPRIKEMVAKAGYEYAFTTKSGKFEKGDDPLEIRRITVFGNMSLLGFLLRLWL